jgi:hypothetical protein
MSLRHIARRRAPLDGTWFRTEARLNGVLHSKTRWDNNVEYPSFVNDTIVPLFMKMVKYKAIETPLNPDGMIFGPVVRIGSMESPEFDMFGLHYNAGLFKDYSLDTYDYKKEESWLYRVIDGDKDAPGEDASAYECSKCNHWLYRDEQGRRYDRSACLLNGELVCRDCDFTGLVYDSTAEEQLDRCRKLAQFLGDDHISKFERQIEHLSHGFCWGRPSQTRLFKEDRFSFAWSTVMLMDDDTRKQGMNGGLIQHGPCPIIGEDGKYRFETYDYGEKKVREATPEEVGNISWSIHT